MSYDQAFIQMVRDALTTIERGYGCKSPEIESWDQGFEVDWREAESFDFVVETTADVSHAIGFICGCATALDMTPLEFLDTIPRDHPARKHKARTT